MLITTWRHSLTLDVNNHLASFPRRRESIKGLREPGSSLATLMIITALSRAGMTAGGYEHFTLHFEVIPSALFPTPSTYHPKQDESKTYY
jgi:hypothetical protein